MNAQRGECPDCHRLYQVTSDGLVRQHRDKRGGQTCPGVGKIPARVVEVKPPTVV